MSDENALHLTALVPSSASDPVVMYDPHAAVRMAVVERDHVSRLGSQWDAPGNYLLLDPIAADGSWGAYVGRAAPGGIRSRLMSHLKSKDQWRRALLIQRDTTHGFSSAHVAWLEGRLCELLDAAHAPRLSNANRPRDETLPHFERAPLEACVLSVSRVLRLLGYDLHVTAPHEPLGRDSAEGPPRRQFKVGILDLVAAGVLSPGTALPTTSPARSEVATLRANGIEVDGVLHPTLSAAAAAIRGGATNGWQFFSVQTADGLLPLAEVRSRYLAAARHHTT